MPEIISEIHLIIIQIIQDRPITTQVHRLLIRQKQQRFVFKFRWQRPGEKILNIRGTTDADNVTW